MSRVLRDAAPADAEAICGYYNPHVTDSIVSFDEVALSTHEMAERIATIGASLPWIVAETPSGIAAYAHASRHWTRAAYRHSVESTIYVRDDMRRQGLGEALYGALLTRLRAQAIHAVIAGISLPNGPSVALHEKCGFRKVAHFAEVGFKLGRWIDVGYWQITL